LEAKALEGNTRLFVLRVPARAFAVKQDQVASDELEGAR